MDFASFRYSCNSLLVQPAIMTGSSRIHRQFGLNTAEITDNITGRLTGATACSSKVYQGNTQFN